MQLNPNGTIPEPEEEYNTATSTVSFTSTWKACPHHTGWFFTVKFLWFKKKLFWCDLCHCHFDANLINALEKARKEDK